MLHKYGADVEKVLSRLREHGLVAELSKVSFFSRRVEFCGHVLENGTRRPAEGKLVALGSYKAPRSLKELRSFLGLAHYHNGYVNNYAELAAPLMEMLKGQPTAQEKSSSRSK